MKTLSNYELHVLLDKYPQAGARLYMCSNSPVLELFQALTGPSICYYIESEAFLPLTGYKNSISAPASHLLKKTHNLDGVRIGKIENILSNF